MDREREIQTRLTELETRASSGYALAFHIEYTTPVFLFQTYPTEWSDIYSRKGYVMQDPTVHWGFANTGSVRWSELEGDDAAGVMAEAAEHGLRYGVCYATETGGSRSVASFARDDREFTDEEIATLCEEAEALHVLTADLRSLSPETAAALRRQSIRVTHGNSR